MSPAPSFLARTPLLGGWGNYPTSITAIVVKYAPGAKRVKHHHAGSVLAYVLSG
jgi:hypothetical protein